jgi:NAD(P)-dependent dehydrogenase (short-subunit alcohol dehydrogenase family)
MDLAGRHAIVTGGGRGIGAAIAAAFTAAGADVTILGRNETPLRTLVADGHAARWVVADITDESGLVAALRPFLEADILVNNAGAVETERFLTSDTALFQRMMAVNFYGATFATRALLPRMLSSGFGRVINIASTASQRGYGYVSAYCAAKHALLGFTRALALELAQSPITVNAICPGYTDTDLVASSVATIIERTGRDEVSARAVLAASNPQKRLIAPDEVAAAACYLASAAARGVTGQALGVSGGEVM